MAVDKTQMPEPLRWKVDVGPEETTAVFEAAVAPASGATLILGHGAGGDMDFHTILSLAAELRRRGVSVVRFNFLYTEKKKGPPDRMPRLMECFASVAAKLRAEAPPERLLIGGHSMGGRAASMMAAEGFDCDGAILMSYPLHPAGQPEKLRDAHLSQIRLPVLCFNGTRDDLCQRELMDAVVAKLPPTFTMHWLEGADHGYHVRKRSGRTDADIIHEIGAVSQDWIAQL